MVWRRRHKEIIRFGHAKRQLHRAELLIFRTHRHRRAQMVRAAEQQLAAERRACSAARAEQHGIAVRADENSFSVPRAQRLDRQPVRIYAICPLRQFLRHAGKIRQLNLTQVEIAEPDFRQMVQLERRRAGLRIAFHKAQHMRADKHQRNHAEQQHQIGQAANQTAFFPLAYMRSPLARHQANASNAEASFSQSAASVAQLVTKRTATRPSSSFAQRS